MANVPRVRPAKILLLRHGQAEGNLDETVFSRKPDHRLELTPRGREQAREAGARVAALTGGGLVQAYISPYVRTRQTLEELRPFVRFSHVREEPRLREQDWGNFQDQALIRAQRAERDAFGHFYYRLARGESGADVYDRVSTFLESLHRDFREDEFPDAALIVTHGLTMRLFLMRWFHWTVEQFEALENPHNGELVVLTRGAQGWYTLDAPLRTWRDGGPPPA